MRKDRGVQFYWTQKDPTSARNIFDKYCKENDVILDPFLGGGSSLYAIRNSKYKFIGVEINEMPYEICCFNSQGINTNLINSINKDFLKLRSLFEESYKYKLNNGDDVTIERVVFDDKENPKLKSISYRDSNNRLYKNECNIELFNLYKERNQNYKNNNLLNSDILLERNSRIAVKDNMYLSSIFSPVNFYVLDLISQKMNKNMKFILGSVLHLCKLTDLKSQSQFPYWIPKKNIVDRNIFSAMAKKITQLSKINTSEIKKVNSFANLKKYNSSCLLLNKPIQKITNNDIPDNSIDFILTDPPYFDQVAYSEYLKIWESFTGYKSYFKDEIIVSQRINNTKTTTDYLNLMTEAFEIIFKKLKPNGNMVIYFKDSRLDKMGEFLKILNRVGFAFISQDYISTKKFTYKQNTSKKSTIAGDSIFHFSKKINNTPTLKQTGGIEPLIKQFVTKYLNKHKKASLGELLNNGLLKHLYDNNSINEIINTKNFLSIIEEYCRFVDDERVYILKN
jgi:DNA modification methylase